MQVQFRVDTEAYECERRDFPAVGFLFDIACRGCREARNSARLKASDKFKGEREFALNESVRGLQRNSPETFLRENPDRFFVGLGRHGRESNVFDAFGKRISGLCLLVIPRCAWMICEIDETETAFISHLLISNYK
jgi:hypothetical protein